MIFFRRFFLYFLFSMKFLLFIIATSNVIFANSNFYMVVDLSQNNTLPVYTSATTKSKQIAEIAYNARFLILEKCIKNKDKEEWCKLDYPFTRYLTNSYQIKKIPEAWVQKKYIKEFDYLTHQEEKRKGYRYKVIKHKENEFLNVRAGRGTEYNIINQLPYDQANIDIQSCQKNESGVEWCWIEFKSDTRYKNFGWVSSKYLDIFTDISFVFKNKKTTTSSEPFVSMNHDEGSRVIYISDRYFVTFSGYMQYELKVWDKKSLKLLKTYESIENINSDEIIDTKGIKLKKGQSLIHNHIKLKLDSNFLSAFDKDKHLLYKIPVNIIMLNSIDIEISGDLMIFTEGYINDPIKIYNFKTGKLIKKILVNDPDIYGEDRSEGDPGVRGEIGWHNYVISDSYLYTVADDYIRVWNLTDGQLVKKLHQCGRLLGVNQNNYVADFCKFEYSEDNKIKIYDKETEKLKHTIKRCSYNASDDDSIETLTQLELHNDYLLQTCSQESFIPLKATGQMGFVRVIDINGKKVIYEKKGTSNPIEPAKIWKNYLLVIGNSFVDYSNPLSPIDYLSEVEENKIMIFDLVKRKKIIEKNFDSKIATDPIAFGRSCIRINDSNNKANYYKWNEKKIWKVKSCRWDEIYDNKLALTYEHKNVMRLYDRESEKDLVTFYYFNNNDWLAITPEGYFNGSRGATQHLSITKYTDHGMEPFDFSQLYDHFFRPDLVKLKLSGDEEAYQKAIKGMTYKEALKNPPPKISLLKAGNATITKSGYDYNDLNTTQPNTKLTFNVQEHDGGGIGLIRIYQEGKLIQSIGEGKDNRNIADVYNRQQEEEKDKQLQALQANPEKMQLAMKEAKNNSSIKSAQLPISQIIASASKESTSTVSNQEGNQTIEATLQSGENQFCIEAFNKTNTVTSYRECMTIHAQIPKQKPKLYGVVAGVNTFAQEVWNLKYSEQDAKAIKESIEEGAKHLYSDIEITPLLGNEVNQDNILSALQAIKAKANINDTILFFISTHGEAYNNNLWLLPYDPRSHKINFQKVFDAVQSIPSLKQLFIVDACQSGKASDIMASVYDSRASVLAKSAGVHLLLATTKSTSAFESQDPKVKNSVFTYKILQALKDKKTDTNKDNAISVIELSNTLKDQANDTEAQYPVIRNVGGDVKLKEAS